jgi:hypothetical protein
MFQLPNYPLCGIGSIKKLATFAFLHLKTFFMKKKNLGKGNKLSLNKKTITLLNNSMSNEIVGGARSGEEGPRSCVNKQTICDCPETAVCPTGICPTAFYLGTRCF